MGYFTALGLIFAIGTQNAFVLRCGLKNHHTFLVCLICALSDTLLIALGVLGMGEVILSVPWLGTAALILGVVFVSVYGFLRIRAYFYPEVIDEKDVVIPSLYKTVLMTLAFTWLNPHVYVDTVFLIGTISTQFIDPMQRLAFGLSAALASVTFFFGLGYSARVAAPLFNSAERWRYVDLCIGILMFVIAVQFGLKAYYGSL